MVGGGGGRSFCLGRGMRRRKGEVVPGDGLGRSGGNGAADIRCCR